MTPSVSRDRCPLHELPARGRVGTGSARRRALLFEARPDLEVVDVRGNVGTRIEKVRSGDLDAVILAAAGLRRLGLLGEASEVFPPELFLPAPGQGALALQARADDPISDELKILLDDPDTHDSVRAERGFLARLGAGCLQPVAAFASIHGDTIELRALIVPPEGQRPAAGTRHGPRTEPEVIGLRLAEDLLAAP